MELELIMANHEKQEFPRSDEILSRLTLEKLEINTRLTKLEMAIEALMTLYTETNKATLAMLGQHAQQLTDHSKFLYGDATNFNSASVRIDRLESFQTTQKWTIKVMWGAIITFVLKIFGDFMSAKR